MSERSKLRLSWVLVGAALLSGGALMLAGSPVGASDDHERARAYLDSGRILPLSRLLDRAELDGYKVLEAELEDEDGRLVYELELLGADGQVIERDFDAQTGDALNKAGDR